MPATPTAVSRQQACGSCRAFSDLATVAFVPRAENVILAGLTGDGRSHLMNALAVEALKRGFTA
jgi:DNA replication protein DnaC